MSTWTIRGVPPETRQKIKMQSVKTGKTIAQLIIAWANKL